MAENEAEEADVRFRSQRPTGGDKAVPQEAVFPAQEGVPVLRREGRRHQLQGRAHAGSFLTERGKISRAGISGVCAPHQKRLAEAIKQARNIALLPFSPK